MSRLLQFELRRIFARPFTRAGLLILAVLSILFTAATYRNMYAFDGVSREGSGGEAVAIDREVAARYAGVLTDEKVQLMLSDFPQTADLHGMNAAMHYENATQSALYRRFVDQNGNWNGLHVADVFGEGEVRIGYVWGWLETSQNMTILNTISVFVLILCLAPVYTGEYGGPDSILFSSRYGRTKCVDAKRAAALLTCLIPVALVAAICIIPAVFLYGAEGLGCSILFGPAGFIEDYIPFNITCGRLLFDQILLALTCAISVTGVTLAISSISRNLMITFAASAALYLFPLLVPAEKTSSFYPAVTLTPLYQTEFLTLMSVDQMDSGVLFAVLAIPVGVLLLMAGWTFSGFLFSVRQVE